MKTATIGFIALLLVVIVAFSGCTQGNYSAPSNSGASNDAAYTQAAQDAGNLQAGDASDLSNQLDQIDSSLDEVSQADPGQIDTTQ